MTQISTILREAIAQGGLLALPLALVGGVITGLNPCCLPMYPAAAATCCAARGEVVRVSLRNAASFILGIAVTTALLGLLAALAGRTMAALGGWPAYLIALVPIVMGLHILGWPKLPLPKFSTPRNGLGGSFIAGLLLSLVVAPCGTPVLASVLSFAAYRHSAVYGALLLFIYGLGAGIPIMLVGTAAGGIAQKLDEHGLRRWVDAIAGAGLICFGLYLLWTA